MSLVFSSLGCRFTAALISALVLSGCSGSDRVPFADVGGPRAGDQLVGKVDRKRDDGRVLVGRVGDTRAEAAAYAAPASSANAGSDGLDYLDTPNLSENEAPQAAPMIATADPGSVGDGQYQGQDQSQGQEQAMSAMVIPEGGVNIDGALGIGEWAPVSDLNSAEMASPVGVQPHVVTQGGAMAIAEGSTSQPVVDGIGFDEPTQIVTGPNATVSDGYSTVDAALTVEPVAATMAEEGGILPLAVDSGNSGMDDPAPVSTRRAPAAKRSGAPAGKDCSLYLDKRNCR